MHVNTDDPGTLQGSSTNTGVVLKDATLDSYSDGSSHIFSEFVDMDAIRRDLGQSASSFTSDDLEDGDQLSILFNLYKLGEKKQLKQLLRQSMWPADHMIRHSLWTSLCKHLLRADGDLYDEMDKELFGDDGEILFFFHAIISLMSTVFHLLCMCLIFNLQGNIGLCYF